MRSRLGLAVVLAAVFMLAGPARSADIAIQSTAAGELGLKVSLTLTGPIEKGDAAKLGSLLDGITEEISVTTLSMHSEGGSYAEGMLLARLFTKRLVSTRVKSGAHCFSACALAFMGGATQGLEGGDFISRAVEAGGRLGFHAPYLNVEQRQYTETAVEYAYAKAVGSIADMIRLADEIAFSTDILPEILDKRPGEMKELVTVDDFARFGVDILPVPQFAAITQSMVQNACQNGYVWGSTKKPGQLRDNLIAAQKPQMKVYSRKDDYFTGDMLKVYRVVMETGEGGEGSINWCLFDYVRTADGKSRTSCRGFVNANTLDEALARARQFDSSRSDANPDMPCALPIAQIFVDGEQDEANADVFGMVPYNTSVSEIQAVIDRYMREEKPLVK